MDRTADGLQQLILDCHRARPEDLPDLAMTAGRDLGLGTIVVYTVDYGQVQLVPFAGGSTPPRERLAVDGTLAGRAYALSETFDGRGDDGYRLWMPLISCSHRLGVMEVVAEQPLSEEQRRTCAAVAGILAALVVVRRPSGDAIEQLRRGLPMQLATEILWSLLPPLTFATDAAVVSGILEPCYNVGGDAFDYAISGNLLRVALFDAVGHGIGASMLTTIAVNAYRNARRCGLDLFDTLRSVDKFVHAQFPDLFVTAILAELDTVSGRLRLISAGHPGGLLLRDGQLVKDLPAPTAMPLGLGELESAPPQIVEEDLQPGDHVLLYTDGVVEARDSAGHLFGRQRLVDFVVRTMADRVPPPETMRRLVRAILEYQHEQLQDDASALLVRWTGATPPA